jgi:hypothetical protein
VGKAEDNLKKWRKLRTTRGVGKLRTTLGVGKAADNLRGGER